jgi:hypothetical protein
VRPRPLTIRANAAECVEITMTNRMPDDREPDMTSMHVHFVGYDVLGSGERDCRRYPGGERDRKRDDVAGDER